MVSPGLAAWLSSDPASRARPRFFLGFFPFLRVLRFRQCLGHDCSGSRGPFRKPIGLGCLSTLCLYQTRVRLRESPHLASAALDFHTAPFLRFPASRFLAPDSSASGTRQARDRHTQPQPHTPSNPVPPTPRTHLASPTPPLSPCCPPMPHLTVPRVCVCVLCVVWPPCALCCVGVRVRAA